MGITLGGVDSSRAFQNVLDAAKSKAIGGHTMISTAVCVIMLNRAGSAEAPQYFGDRGVSEKTVNNQSSPHFVRRV